MGGEVAGNSPPVGSDLEFVLAELFRQLDVGDPDLLARLVYFHAGPDLEARRFGLEAETLAIRRAIRIKLNRIQSTAKSVLGTARARRELDALELAIADVIAGPESTFSSILAARKYLELLREIAATPVRSNLKDFGLKPELDVTTTRIIVGIKAYFDEKGIPFTGKPKLEKVDGGKKNIIKSRAAILIEAVLGAMQIKFEIRSIGTHMDKANEALPK